MELRVDKRCENDLDWFNRERFFPEPMKLLSNKRCERDPLLKLYAVARLCIDHIGCLCGICWDDPPEGVYCELYHLADAIDSLPTLANTAALLPGFDNELTGASDGVVSVCGLSATNAHQAVLRLADSICCVMFHQVAVIHASEPGSLREGHIDPKDAGFGDHKDVMCLRELLRENEPEAVFRKYAGLWKQACPPVTFQEIGRLVKRFDENTSLHKTTMRTRSSVS